MSDITDYVILGLGLGCLAVRGIHRRGAVCHYGRRRPAGYSEYRLVRVGGYVVSKSTGENKPMSWKHPTGNTPKSVCILGLGPTSQDWHTAHVAYNPPLPQVDEVWTVNKGFRTVRASMAFIMDDLVDEARKSERYGREIASISEAIPVLTSTVDPLVKERWPRVLKYPLKEVLEFWGKHIYACRTKGTTETAEDVDPLRFGLDECSYFNNSIPYMLAYIGACCPAVEVVYMFGCDYTFPGNQAREDDRANAEYWLAALQYGLGIAFRFPHRTTILSRDKGRVFYGFNGRQPF